MAKAKEDDTRLMTASEIKQFHEFEAEQGGDAQAQGLGGGLARRLVRFAVSIVAARAKKKNPNFDEEGFKAEVDNAVEAIGDGAIWGWLVDGGFAKILEWVMLILSLFGGAARSKPGSEK